MLTMFYAVKGGSGTTVTSALTALAHDGPTLLVDLDHELPAALGVAVSDRPGVADWLSSDAPLDHLDDLLVTVNDTTNMLVTRHHGTTSTRREPLPTTPATRWMQLSSWCRTWATRTGGRVLIDCGTLVLPDEFVAACDDRILVTRACYLALTDAARRSHAPSGVIVVREPGRALTDRDIEGSVSAPVVATLIWEPTIARSVDSGLLSARRGHRSTSRELIRFLRSSSTAPAAAA